MLTACFAAGLAFGHVTFGCAPTTNHIITPNSTTPHISLAICAGLLHCRDMSKTLNSETETARSNRARIAGLVDMAKSPVLRRLHSERARGLAAQARFAAWKRDAGCPEVAGIAKLKHDWSCFSAAFPKEADMLSTSALCRAGAEPYAALRIVLWTAGDMGLVPAAAVRALCDTRPM